MEIVNRKKRLRFRGQETQEPWFQQAVNYQCALHDEVFVPLASVPDNAPV